MASVTLNLTDLNTIGRSLNRPECVLAHQSGTLFVPDWTKQGGVTTIHPDGSCHSVLHDNEQFTVRPNGIALEPDGSCLLAHLGDEQGGIYRLSANGQLTPEVLRVNGQPMPPANYVVRDKQNRMWITVSTRVIPRAQDYRAAACSGFICVAEPGETNARIVADNLGYTNECVIDEANRFVYVNETFARRLTRFELLSDGSLKNPQTIVSFGPATYPDGLALAVDGSLWVTSIVSNRIIRVSTDGSYDILLEDCTEDHMTLTEEAYTQDMLGRKHLDNVASQQLKNISNLAFGGNNLETAYLGNLLGDSISWFKSPVAGVQLPHWDANIDEWQAGV